MPAVCLYLQIHQPFRLRKFTIFNSDTSYFDQELNGRLIRSISEKCYLPATTLLLELVKQHRGRFRFALSVTGTALEQFESHAPEVMQHLHALAESGGVEFLGETFYHSLSSLYSRAEFAEQIELHRKMIYRLFGQTPTVFRNTELIYSDAIAATAREHHFSAILAEGWEKILASRSAAFAYRTPVVGAGGNLALLLRNHHLSDAVAFRFSNPASADFPLTAEKFAAAVSQIGGQLCNLFMDFETFGEHQPAASGIFEFLRDFPGKLLAHNNKFLLPSEIASADTHDHSAGPLSVPEPMSWADAGRDLGAWTGNAMQKNALDELYKLEGPIKQHAKNGRLLADWRKLTTSDHFYYMSTKSLADGQVHAYFRPYESPYDAYINFMNVLDNLRARL